MKFNNRNPKPPKMRICASIIVFVLSLFPGISVHASDNSLCARVKIEIKQELTLERQAFDAHMRINNGLTNLALENVKVVVKFSDKDGNPVSATNDPYDTSAIFFIRVDTMDGINDVNGAGEVAPSSAADIHWLIIPAPGAAEENPRGTLYYVGATLTYTIGGEEHVTEVSPDYIYVKPMPELVLDYFLPKDVYGDDAFTFEIEPPVPFSLGVRVKNNGFGVARDLKIESAQPKIVENENQLLIGFTITGSEVNGEPWTDSLLVDFGDIEPNKCGTARWTMECTLSGKFVEFTADFTHSDELGGELTSLVDAVNTHFLIHDVFVDMPGRDNIKDFLAKDGDSITVYESDGVDTGVTDQSSLSSLAHVSTSGTVEVYKLKTPVTQGFMYISLGDPTNGRKVIKKVIREDGKELDPANAWIHKERKQDHSWRYLFKLFDFNTPGRYQVIFDEPEAGPPAPVLEFIPDRTVNVGERISFIVHATNPDGTIPLIGANNIPDGAQFWDRGDGYGVFDWTPTEEDTGLHKILFYASNGELTDSQNATIIVGSGLDTDHDGLPDDIEFDNQCTYKTNPDSDGDGLKDGEEDVNKNGTVDVKETDPCAFDTDGDGLSDGKEVLIHHTDPLKVDTDGDGWSDYDEVLAGSDPLDEMSKPNTLTLPGDITQDGSVDGKDLILLAGALGIHKGQTGYIALADLNEDNVIDQKDTEIFAMVFSLRKGEAYYIKRADFNRDGAVDGRDLSLISKAFGESMGNSGYDPAFDLNSNGLIDAMDIRLFLCAFGTKNTSGSP